MTMSETEPVTTATPFEMIPAADAHLFEVRADVPASWAFSSASCLTNSVRELCNQAIDSADGMSVETAYLCAFALGAVEALIDSVRGQS